MSGQQQRLIFGDDMTDQEVAMRILEAARPASPLAQSTPQEAGDAPSKPDAPQQSPPDEPTQ